MEKVIEKLLCYAESHLCLEKEDAVYVRNILLKLFGCSAPYEGEIDREAISSLEVPDSLLDEVRAYYEKKGLSPLDVEKETIFAFSLLCLKPSEINDVFYHYLKNQQAEKATEFLYDYSIKNGYIALSKIRKNLHWDATFKNGDPAIEVSINLSRPEKSNKDNAKLLTAAPSHNYPKCMLCYENLGFEGNAKIPPRGTLRFVPLSLYEGEEWYLQYSPYAYFDHHCIVFGKEHTNMHIDEKTIVRLLHFVDLFPHFFLGSNADLPIVGGSILDHDHYQGGSHLLPLLKADVKEWFETLVPGVRMGVIDFYNSSLRLESKDEKALAKMAAILMERWKNYTDEENGIIAFDESGRHNTITPFARKHADHYSLDIVLRNNRTDTTYPDGIFHAHPEYHHIKSEGIGLIEAAGLFILPPRVFRQSKQCEEVVAEGLNREEYLSRYPDLEHHDAMIAALKKGQSVEDYISDVCRKILRNTAVFKDTPSGKAGFARFLEGLKHE